MIKLKTSKVLYERAKTHGKLRNAESKTYKSNCEKTVMSDMIGCYGEIMVASHLGNNDYIPTHIFKKNNPDITFPTSNVSVEVRTIIYNHNRPLEENNKTDRTHVNYIHGDLLVRESDDDTSAVVLVEYVDQNNLYLVGWAIAGHVKSTQTKTMISDISAYGYWVKRQLLLPIESLNWYVFTLHGK